MTDLGPAVETVLAQCLAVKPGEQVLVLTDPGKRVIAEALVATARAAEAEVLLLEMAEREGHGTEPPGAVSAAMSACDVLVAPTTRSISHTEARRSASERGVRVATMPDVTEEMLARTMAADYDAVARRSKALAAALSDGREVRITTDKGTDVTLSIEGRPGKADDGKLTAPGAFGNLPAGEGYIAPVEGTSKGRIVFDGSIGPVGLLREPLVVDVEDGYATGFSGPGAERLRELLGKHGREAFAVAELGIGTNETATVTGNVLEDEKVIGTIHIAFGDNHSFGGRIRVASHQDGVVLSPTVMIDTTPVLERGNLLV